MAASVTETYEFAVSGIPTLRVKHAIGSITITAGAAGQTYVVVTKKSREGIFGGMSEADLAELRVAVQQEGDRITIDSSQQRKFNLLGRNYTIDIEVKIPAATNLDLNISAGSAEARSITGLIEAEVNAGSFEASDVTFANGSSLTVNAGQVVAQGALDAGASMSVEANAGSVKLTLPKETPTYLDAKASAGAIDVFGWPVQVSSRFAQQQASGPLAPNASGALRVRVNAGSVSLRAR